MIVPVSVVLLVSGVLGALGTQRDIDNEAPPDASAQDMFTYLVPNPNPWVPLTPQEIYFETANAFDQIPEERFKRAGNGPSLSIVNPLDVLRQRLLLEMARRQMRESQKQVAENRKLMKTIGKRGSFLRQPYNLQ